MNDLQLQVRLSSVIAKHEERLISDFDPPRPCHKIKDLSRKRGYTGCCHNIFESPEQFINFILWVQHPKSFQIAD